MENNRREQRIKHGIFALYDCMNYQGFRLKAEGTGPRDVTRVTDYVTMYPWEHGSLKRAFDWILSKLAG